MIADFHRQCRAAVRNAIEADRVADPAVDAAWATIREVAEQDEFDGERITGPAVVCYFLSQAIPVGGTMQRDDWKFPIVVGLKTTGVNTGGRTGPHPTQFLGLIQDIFHNRRPAGLPSRVYRCEIDPQGATATNEEKYQQLQAATTVVLTARFNRR